MKDINTQYDLNGSLNLKQMYGRKKYNRGQSEL